MNRKRRLLVALAPWLFTALPTVTLVVAGWSNAPKPDPLQVQSARAQTVTAAPASNARLGPVQFTVGTDKPRYASGETITVTLTATNTGKEPAVVLLPVHNGGLKSSTDFTVTDAATGTPLNVEWAEIYLGGEYSPSAQVMVHNRVDAKQFRVLKPGESAPIYGAKFRAAYLPGNDRPSLKTELPRAARNEVPFQTAPVTAGTYRMRGSYSWDRGTEFLKEWHFKDFRFKDADARERFQSAVIGKVIAEGNFEITPAP